MCRLRPKKGFKNKSHTVEMRELTGLGRLTPSRERRRAEEKKSSTRVSPPFSVFSVWGGKEGEEDSKGRRYFITNEELLKH